MKLKNRRGSIFAFVSVLLAIVAIFTTTIIFINMSNLRQVITQEERMKAYYLAYSGAEMAYAALFKGRDKGEAIIDKFDEKFDGVEAKDIAIGKEGYATVEIDYDYEKDKVTITSTGTYEPSNRTVTLKMSFYKEYPQIKLWE